MPLTSFASVGWLSRGDLAVIDHAAGPIMPTPAAQELGPHRFDYAVLLHAGDWSRGDVLTEARSFATPPITVSPSGTHKVPAARALVEVTPTPVVLSSVTPAETGRGVVVRVVNNSGSEQKASVRPGFASNEVVQVDPLERELGGGRVEWSDGVARLTVKPWEIATLLFRS
jgi:alpha-mannosidase